jgi:DNA adenine methylase
MRLCYYYLLLLINIKSIGLQKQMPHKIIPAVPFLKWAGGKRQLLSTYQQYYPKALMKGEVTHYCEPFLGGGAVFFDVVQRYPIQSACLMDTNSELILTYQVVQRHVYKLMEELKILQDTYTKKCTDKQKEYFYEVRRDFNQNRASINFTSYSSSWIKRAAQIIFLNKTCFNGLFRFNLKGEFNTPAGRYKNPKILDESNLQKAAKTLEIAEIYKSDYRDVLTRINANSFVYFDPPYRPISTSSSFTAYGPSAFNDVHQIELATLYEELNKKGILLMLSNSDPKNTNPADNFFDDLYKNFHLFRIPAKRVINSNAQKRQAINEILVTNYRVK